MTDTPYTAADLRREAARQHAALVADPEFMCVGEQMSDEEVTPGGGVLWSDFSDATYDRAQRAIHDLIASAADTSAWAVQLGAEGMVPSPITISVSTPDGVVRARVLFAFTPDLTGSDHSAVINPVRAALSDL